jgi:hypothetical protein
VGKKCGWLSAEVGRKEHESFAPRYACTAGNIFQTDKVSFNAFKIYSPTDKRIFWACVDHGGPCASSGFQNF